MGGQVTLATATTVIFEASGMAYRIVRLNKTAPGLAQLPGPLELR